MRVHFKPHRLILNLSEMVKHVGGDLTRVAEAPTAESPSKLEKVMGPMTTGERVDQGA
jgi:hypothetical protein